MRVMLIGLIVFLTGCAAEVISSNPRSVTVKAGEVMIEEAQEAANMECAKYKRYARLAIRPTAYTTNHWIFDCIE